MKAHDAPNWPAPPQEDAWEGSFWEEAIVPRPVSARLCIDYVDGRGLVTRRNIEVLEFDYGATRYGLMLVHCQLRGAIRTFRFDRVRTATDIDTGDPVDDLPAWLRSRAMASPEAALAGLAERHPELVGVLAFLARETRTGPVGARVRALLRERLGDLLSAPVPIPDGLIARLLERTPALTGSRFRLAVRRLCDGPAAVRSQLAGIAGELLALRAGAHQAEIDTIDYLARRLGREAAVQATVSAAAGAAETLRK